MLFHSHSPIKAGMTKRLIRTIRLLISRHCEEDAVALFDCILRDSYGILIKDSTYEIKVGPHDWPTLVGYK